MSSLWHRRVPPDPDDAGPPHPPLRNRSRETPAHRLLVNWIYDRSPARLGRGGRRVALTCGCPRQVVCSHLACVRRSPRRGVAQEGSAQLEELTALVEA